MGAAGLAALERLEDALDVLGADADAGVLDLELSHLVAIARRKGHVALARKL
jgi:hypothetical protein